MLYLLSFSAAPGNVKAFYVMSTISQDAELGKNLKRILKTECRLILHHYALLKILTSPAKA